MKLTAIILLAGALHLSAKTSSQTITLRASDISLKKAFDEIEKQTGYYVVSNKDLLAKSKKVSVDVKNIPLSNFLQLIFSDQPLMYMVEENNILVAQKPAAELSLRLPDLDTPPVKGVIRDAEGKPLAGVNVVVKGTKRGTSSDAYGNFLIDAKPGEKLVISSIGYNAQELIVTDQNNIAVSLSVSNSPLDEVQIIAYGQQSRRLSTGDVTTISSKEIETQPVSDVLQAIQGRVPGMSITQNSGMPGANFKVQIQGQISIMHQGDPLYVIDGVPYLPSIDDNALFPSAGGKSALYYISPDNIESISVLKDADATAIYGSRAAAGAILITTKKGRAGNTRLDVSANFGSGTAHSGADWLNTPEYLEMRKNAFKNDNVIPDEYNAPDLTLWDSTRYTNWQKELTGGSARFDDVHASLSGGTDNLQYRIGAGYMNQTTVFGFPGSNHNTFTNLNLSNTSADKRFHFTASMNYTVGINNLPQVDMTRYIDLAPNTPSPYNADGSINWDFAARQNPYAALKQTYDSKTNNLVGSALLSYNILKGLDIKSSFGYTNTQTNATILQPISAQNPAYSPTGAATFSTGSKNSWIIEPQATYKFNFGDNYVDFLLGSSFQQNNLSGSKYLALGYTSDALLRIPESAPTFIYQGTFNSLYKYNGVFSRLNFTSKDRYIINVNIRRDGSSRFGPANRFHNFGSVAGAWIFTKEDFMAENLPFLSFGKIRSSYGSTGNDQIGDYQFYELFYPSPFLPYQGVTGLRPNNLGNANLQWEETKKFQVGADLGFLKDGILINLSYYSNLSTNQLLATTLPFITGFNSITGNFPATVRNYGWEFSVSTTNIKSRNFNWSTSFNLTLPHNKLVSFPNLETSTYRNSLIIGQPITIVRGLKYDGVDPASGLYRFGSKTNASAPVYPEDYFLSSVDLAPKFYGGLQNTFNWKDLSFGIFLQFRKQMGLNPLTAGSLQPGSYLTNQPVEVLDNRWYEPGDIAGQQQFSQSYFSNTDPLYQNVKYSDFNYVDASFIRVSNVYLSYQLPEKWTGKAHLHNCQINIRAQNLFTFTSYKGVDPETQGLTVLPPLRVITGGISFSL